MPRYDLYHEEVRHALEKDGWSITADPFVIEYKGLRLYADLGAEKVIAAEKENRKIVVEIKVFGTPSPVSELEKAIGQYGIYRTLIRRVSPEYSLWLAAPDDVYEDFFLRPAIREITADHSISMLVFNPETEEIVRWINQEDTEIL
ncbi:element excision factor XisH family protein [Desulfococcaceae bacterium HSG8]|nr:element excision factor XisH family protein [Desulfococcaceae bacterium HSG8]